MNMNVPDGWRIMKLTDISENISAGGTPAREKKEYWQEGTIPWLKIADMKFVYIKETEEKITKLGLNKSSAKLFQKGTLVYSIFATLGAIGILEIDAATNQAIAGITPKKEIISTKYLYYCLKAERDKILSKKSHATQDNLNLTILRNHEIVVPPLPTQQKIVSILEKAEKAKEWRKEADELTKDFLKSVFLEMFGDPVKNTKNLVVKKLGDVSTILMGQSPDGASYNGKGNGISLLNGPTEFGIKFPKEKQWTNKPKKLCKVGDILFCVRGATAGRMNISDKVYCIGRGLCAIRAKEGISNEYIYEFLKTKYDHFQNVGQGSTFINIDKEKLHNLLIPIPKKQDSDFFVKLAQGVEQMKEQQKQSKEQIDNLFSALMQKAFNGELFV